MIKDNGESGGDGMCFYFLVSWLNKISFYFTYFVVMDVKSILKNEIRK
jgi:hypothetical protein